MFPSRYGRRNAIEIVDLFNISHSYQFLLQPFFDVFPVEETAEKKSTFLYEVMVSTVSREPHSGRVATL